MMIEELLHGTRLGRRDPLRFLVMASFLKDDLPWFYELAVEAYKEASHKGSRTREAQRRFLSALKALRHGPFIEMIGDKDSFMMMRELDHFFFAEPDLHSEEDAMEQEEEAPESQVSATNVK